MSLTPVMQVIGEAGGAGMAVELDVISEESNTQDRSCWAHEIQITPHRQKVSI